MISEIGNLIRIFNFKGRGTYGIVYKGINIIND